MYALNKEYPGSGRLVTLRWYVGPAVGREELEIHLKSLYVMGEPGRYSLDAFSSLLNRVADDPAARYVFSQAMSKSVAFATNFELARTWLRECNETHPDCGVFRKGTPPLRFVEIQWEKSRSSPTVRVVNGSEGLQYAALTYCWGATSCIEEIKFTKVNFQNWIREIPFSQHPKTLQDGVITTWKLGLRFLWIDCLCILQDDKTEKANEIAKMPQIYRGAFITISAARSKSSDEGFLHDIHVPSEGASIFRMAYACPDGRLGSLLLFDDPLPQYVEPVDTRGLTLQEYILPPRLLAYGLHGLRFRCRQRVQQDNEETTEKSFSARNNRKLALLRAVPENIEIARTTWSKILLEYSCRTLSHFEDRLLAISGIAKYYSDTLKDDYLAGLWHRDLPGALMWQNVSAERYPRTRSGWAPSWSWAAIKGAVHNFYGDMHIDPILDIVSHDIQLVEPAAPFGDVLSGRIYLNARLKAAL